MGKRIKNFFKKVKFIFSPWRWFKKKKDEPNEEAPAEDKVSTKTDNVAPDDNKHPDVRPEIPPGNIIGDISSNDKTPQTEDVVLMDNIHTKDTHEIFSKDLRRKAHQKILQPADLNVSKKEKALKQKRERILRRGSDLEDTRVLAQEIRSPKTISEYQKKLLERETILPPELTDEEKEKIVESELAVLSEANKTRIRKIDDELYYNDEEKHNTDIQLAHLSDKKKLKILLAKEKQHPLSEEDIHNIKELQEKVLIFNIRESWEEMTSSLEDMQKKAIEAEDTALAEHIDLLFQVQLKADNFDDIRLAFNQLAKETGIFEPIGIEKARYNYERPLISPGRMHKKIESDIQAVHQKIMAMEKHLLIKELRILISNYLRLSKRKKILGSTTECESRKNIINIASKLWLNMHNNEDANLQFFSENDLRLHLRKFVKAFKKNNKFKKASYQKFNREIKALNKQLPIRKNLVSPKAQQAISPVKTQNTKRAHFESPRFTPPKRKCNTPEPLNPTLRRSRKFSAPSIQFR